MKDFVSIVLVSVLGVLVLFGLCNRTEQFEKENKLVQNYSYNCEFSNN